MGYLLNIEQEIQNIMKNTVGKSAMSFIQQDSQQVTTMAQTILSLCNVFVSQLDQAIIQETKYGTFSAKTVKKKSSKYTWVQLMTYGAQIIYLIRYMLTNEEIQFLFGATAKGTGETKTTMVSQSEIMPLLTKVGKNSIGIKISELENKLKSLDNLMSSVNMQRRNQWAQIQSLTNIDGYNKQPEKNLNAHRIYQKIHEDQLIYVKFSEKSRRKSLYYDINNTGNPEDFVFFNMGWLWEWYNAILLGDNDSLYQAISQQIDNKSIKGLISTSDKIPGTKQGDFMDAQQRQVQAKFNNEKIISYNNIKVIMIQLQEALNNYLYGEQDVQTKQNNLIQVLQRHFFPEGALIADNLANQTAEKIINKLNSIIKT